MKYEHLDMPTKKHLITSWCIGCKHFNGLQKGTCSAYPDGIPERFADAFSGNMPEKHDSIQKDQIGNFIFANDAWSR